MAAWHISISLHSFDNLITNGLEIRISTSKGTQQTNSIKSLHQLCSELDSSFNILNTLTFLNDVPELHNLLHNNNAAISSLDKHNSGYQLCFTLYGTTLFVYTNYFSSVYNMRGNLYGNCLIEEFFLTFISELSEYCPFYYVKDKISPPHQLVNFCPTFLYNLPNITKDDVSFIF